MLTHWCRERTAEIVIGGTDVIDGEMITTVEIAEGIIVAIITTAEIAEEIIVAVVDTTDQEFGSVWLGMPGDWPTLDIPPFLAIPLRDELCITALAIATSVIAGAHTKISLTGGP